MFFLCVFPITVGYWIITDNSDINQTEVNLALIYQSTSKIDEKDLQGGRYKSVYNKGQILFTIWYIIHLSFFEFARDWPFFCIFCCVSSFFFTNTGFWVAFRHHRRWGIFWLTSASVLRIVRKSSRCHGSTASSQKQYCKRKVSSQPSMLHNITSLLTSKSFQINLADVVMIEPLNIIEWYMDTWLCLFFF